MAIASGQVQGYNNPDRNQTVQIVGGIATVTGPGKITLQAETGTEDTLTQIIGLQEGDKVTLFADSGDTITIANGTYLSLTRDLNMPLVGGNNMELISMGSDTCEEKTRSIN